MNLKHLLSDRFVEFSSKVADVHGRIKDTKARFQAELKALTDEAEALNVEFESWQKEQDAPAAQKLERASATRNVKSDLQPAMVGSAGPDAPVKS